mmetsp:Transcript_2777/g.10697  ORF Transcript_2777/g.10697 Transcript_2777/m.10697 type:complete len:206 (+) Transcript_2777:1333-1950(+)
MTSSVVVNRHTDVLRRHFLLAQTCGGELKGRFEGLRNDGFRARLFENQTTLDAFGSYVRLDVAKVLRQRPHGAIVRGRRTEGDDSTRRASGADGSEHFRRARIAEVYVLIGGATFADDFWIHVQRYEWNHIRTENLADNLAVTAVPGQNDVTFQVVHFVFLWLQRSDVTTLPHVLHAVTDLGEVGRDGHRKHHSQVELRREIRAE